MEQTGRHDCFRPELRIHRASAIRDRELLCPEQPDMELSSRLWGETQRLVSWPT